MSIPIKICCAPTVHLRDNNASHSTFFKVFNAKMPPKLNYTEQSLQQAINNVAQGKSQRKAAQDHGVPRSTLQSRLYGHEKATQAHSHELKLSPAQEEFLNSWILHEESAGRAPSKRIIAEFATKVLNEGGEAGQISHH